MTSQMMPQETLQTLGGFLGCHMSLADNGNQLTLTVLVTTIDALGHFETG